MRYAWLAGLALLISPLTHADSLDLQLSGDVFAARFTSGLLGRAASTDIGFMHHTDNGDLIHLGLVVEQGSGQLDSMALGAQVIGLFNDYDNAAALALGGRFSTSVPGSRLRLGGHLWYAPRVTTASADKYLDWGVRLGYQALPRGEIYLGYRKAKISYPNQVNLNMQDDVLVGMDLSF